MFQIRFPPKKTSFFHIPVEIDCWQQQKNIVYYISLNVRFCWNSMHIAQRDTINRIKCTEKYLMRIFPKSMIFMPNFDFIKSATVFEIYMSESDLLF